MGMESIIGGLAPLGDSAISNITGLANTFNRFLVGKGFQDAIEPRLNEVTGNANNRGMQVADSAQGTFDERRSAWESNMADYGQARAGHGTRANTVREGYGRDMGTLDAVIDQGDSLVQPLIKNARDAYDTAQAQYLDTKSKMANAGQEAVSTAREGVTRAIQAGQDIMAGIVDQVATGIKGVATRLEATTKDSETMAAQAEAAGRPDQAASIRQKAAFQNAKVLGDQSQQFRVVQSQLNTDARQKNEQMEADARNMLIATISKTAGDEAGANANSVRNIISAVATGNDAARLAVEGPMRARIEKAAMGERMTHSLVDAIGLDESDIENHAINVDNQIASNAQQRTNNIISGVRLQMEGLSQLIQGHGAIAQILSGVQLSYTPGFNDAVSNYMQLEAAGKEPAGPSGFDRFMQAGTAGAMTAAAFA